MRTATETHRDRVRLGPCWGGECDRECTRDLTIGIWTMLLAKKTTTTDLRRALPAAVNALAELCYPEDSDWQQCEEISLFSNGLCSCATNATTQRAN